MARWNIQVRGAGKNHSHVSKKAKNTLHIFPWCRCVGEAQGGKQTPAQRLCFSTRPSSGREFDRKEKLSWYDEAANLQPVTFPHMNEHFQPTDHHILQTFGEHAWKITPKITLAVKMKCKKKRKKKIPFPLKSWLITIVISAKMKPNMLLLHIVQGKRKSHISEARLRTHLVCLLEKKIV